MESAIIGATVALVIFTMTQLLLHFRARQTLLREKLESLFFVMNETSQSIGKAQKGLMFDQPELIQEGFEGIEKSIYDARPHFLLYFPIFNEIWISQVIEPALNFADRINDLTLSDKEDIIGELHQKTVEIRYFQNMMARNQDLTTETLLFHWNRIVRKRIQFNMPNISSQDSQIEQGGADQPATALESKSEGKKKPKPESEGRSQ